MNRFIYLMLLGSMLGSLLPPSLQAQQAIVLDSTFGVGGIAKFSIGDSFGGLSNGDIAHDLILQPNGKINFCGQGDGKGMLGQLLPHGELDTSFQHVGYTTFGGRGFGGRIKMAQQNDGRFILIKDNGTRGFLSNGVLDTNFGTSYVFFQQGQNPNPLTNRAYDVKIVDENKIVIVGVADPNGNPSFAISRHKSNGGWDDAFGSWGQRHYDFGPTNSHSQANALAIQADGKYLLAGKRGYSSLNSGNHFAIVRFLPNGLIDTSFNHIGSQVIEFFNGTFRSEANAVMVQPDGKILLAGSIVYHNSHAFALCRLNPNGSLDPSFDGDGKAYIFDEDFNGEATDMILQDDGGIMLVGEINRNFALVRFTSTGTLDQTFGNGGIVQTDIGGGLDVIYTVALDAQGRIVVGGTAQDTAHGHFELVLARYLNNYTPNSTGLIPSLASALDLRVYPNPVSGREVNLSCTLKEAASPQLSLMDGQGRVVWHETYPQQAPGEWRQAITLPGNLAAGYYVLRVTTPFATGIVTLTR